MKKSKKRRSKRPSNIEKRFNAKVLTDVTVLAEYQGAGHGYHILVWIGGDLFDGLPAIWADSPAGVDKIARRIDMALEKGGIDELMLEFSEEEVVE